MFNLASTNGASDRSVQFSIEELTMFHLYLESLKSLSTPITSIVESSTSNTCLVSSSSFEWVIDSIATYHMIGNSSLFSTFQSQPLTSIVTLVDGLHRSSDQSRLLVREGLALACRLKT